MESLRVAFFSIVLLVASLDAYSESRSVKDTKIKAFGPGEELHYVLQYGFITGDVRLWLLRIPSLITSRYII